jgi:hypothetical protein
MQGHWYNENPYPQWSIDTTAQRRSLPAACANLDLGAVLVGARDEVCAPPSQPRESRNRIGQRRCVCVPNVWRAVDVEDRRAHVEALGGERRRDLRASVGGLRGSRLCIGRMARGRREAATVQASDQGSKRGAARAERVRRQHAHECRRDVAESKLNWLMRKSPEPPAAPDFEILLQTAAPWRRRRHSQSTFGATNSNRTLFDGRPQSSEHICRQITRAAFCVLSPPFFWRAADAAPCRLPLQPSATGSATLPRRRRAPRPADWILTPRSMLRSRARQSQRRQWHRPHRWCSRRRRSG